MPITLDCDFDAEEVLQRLGFQMHGSCPHHLHLRHCSFPPGWRVLYCGDFSFFEDAEGNVRAKLTYGDHPVLTLFRLYNIEIREVYVDGVRFLTGTAVNPGGGIICSIQQLGGCPQHDVEQIEHATLQLLDEVAPRWRDPLAYWS